MFEKILIYILLILTPLFVLVGHDTREPKMVLAIALLSILSLFKIYKGELGKMSKWLAFFLGSLLLTVLLAPKLKIDGLFSFYSYSYLFQGCTYIIVFSLGYLALKDSLKKIDLALIEKIMIYVGSGLSIYCILQFFGFDQFFINSRIAEGWELSPLQDIIKNLDSPNALGATLGNPTVLAPFLGMILPLAIKNRSYISIILLSVAILMCFSMVCFGALTIGAISYVFYYNKKIALVLLVLLLGSLVFAFSSPKCQRFVNGGGRFATWRQAVKDVKGINLTGKVRSHSLTGLGVNSFSDVFRTAHKEVFQINKFREAHNEYVEIFFNHGLIGLVLILTYWALFLSNHLYVDKHYIVSLVFISACAFGTFVWHIAPICVYTLFIKGMLEAKAL